MSAKPEVTVIRPGMRLTGWKPVTLGGRVFQEFTFSGPGARSVVLLMDDEVMHREGVSVRPRASLSQEPHENDVDGSPGDLCDSVKTVPAKAPIAACENCGSGPVPLQWHVPGMWVCSKCAGDEPPSPVSVPPRAGERAAWRMARGESAVNQAGYDPTDAESAGGGLS